MLTISQLASYAGVSVRAVRHYHAKGPKSWTPHERRSSSATNRH